MKRTAALELDESFEYTCDVTKFWTADDGSRHIRGVATGVEEDRDGERVSKRAIAKMAAQPTGGGAVKLLAGTHTEEWKDEIGAVTKLAHDPSTDELLIEAALPAEGTDPLADKACRKLAAGEKLGFSIGGKLRKAYFELVDTGKTATGPSRPRQRKVLDDIHLRHVTLTSRPSYRGTFCELVAKTAPDEPVGDVEWVDEAPEVEVADAAAIAKTAAPVVVHVDGREVADVAKADDPPAATATNDDDGNPDLPLARHLACPGCGHEFAAPPPENADLMTDPDDRAAKTESETDEETAMGATEDTLAKIRALADEAATAVEKTDEPEIPEVEKTEPDTPEVEEVVKTDDAEASDVEKLVAASHRHLDGRVDDIAKSLEPLNDTLEAIAKAVKTLDERVRAMPQGRKSTARVLPPNSEVEKTATETDDVAKAVTDADNAVDAVKALNAARGIK